MRTFGIRAFEALLVRPEARVWIGEVRGIVVGFLSMIVGSVDPVERRLGGVEIPRIYVIGPAQRTGLGRLLLDAAIEQATTEGLSHVWLDVMASATAARRAYAKWGFREIGGRWFEKPVKVGQSDMVVLLKEVKQSGGAYGKLDMQGPIRADEIRQASSTQTREDADGTKRAVPLRLASSNYHG